MVPYNILKKAIFGAPSFTPGGDKDKHPLSFLYKI